MKFLWLIVGLVSVAHAESPFWDDFPSSHFYPSRSRHSEIISLDLDPQNILNSSFRIAARESQLDDLQRLLAQGADVNSRAGNGMNALMFASRNCAPKMVRFLLGRGAEPNARDFEGRTALIFAAMNACEKVADLLLQTPKIELNATDKSGKTATDYAAESAMLEVGGPAENIIHAIQTARIRGSHGGGNNHGNRAGYSLEGHPGPPQRTLKSTS